MKFGRCLEQPLSLCKIMAVVLEEFNFSALQVAQDLLNTYEECSLRGLKNTAKW